LFIAIDPPFGVGVGWGFSFVSDDFTVDKCDLVGVMFKCDLGGVIL